MAKVKLHRCSYTFLHVDADACWRMEKALKEQGVAYEVVKHGWGKSEKSRSEVVEMSGQKYVPVLELGDGTVFREETDDMIAKLESGDLPGPLS